MNTTLVINPKGGSGKTTVTLNLASYFAVNNIPVTVMDYDPQGSSLNWVRLRTPHAPRIYSGNAARQQGCTLRSMAMYVPAHTQQLLVDAPAGASGIVLQEMLDRASCIIIPLPPSAIDIHATARFVKNELHTARMRARRVPVAVVANKVRRSMPRYQPLDWFLDALDLKLLARLADSDVFLQAAETGVGIFEMDPALSSAECKQFMPIVQWVESKDPVQVPPAERNVYTMGRARFA
jgi:cellulose biosynthesis protein BcsQ